jgi:hypothetical protein
MKVTKTGILTTAAILVLSATTLGTAVALLGKDTESLFRLYAVASVLGTGSIGLFFVGLAFPRETVGATNGIKKTPQA